MKLTEPDIMEAFLISDYFTEENIINHTTDLAKFLFSSDPCYFIDYIKNLPESKKPRWLKKENQSDDLKLFFELAETPPKGDTKEYCAILEKNELFKREYQKLMEIEVYD